MDESGTSAASTAEDGGPAAGARRAADPVPGRDDERRRRGWYLVVLGLIGATALAALAFVLGTPPTHQAAARLPLTLTQVPRAPHPSARAARSHSGKRAAAAQRTRSRTRRVKPGRVRPRLVERPVAAHSTRPPVIGVPGVQPPRDRPSRARHDTSHPHRNRPRRGTARHSSDQRPARTAPPCPGASPCTVPGDAGAAAAIRSFRTSRALPGVAVAVTSAAQQCARSQADPSVCPAPYASWYEYARNGKVAVDSIGSDSTSWLRDATISRVDVGWAYLPARNLWVCALLGG